jgi:hypothetical protein
MFAASGGGVSSSRAVWLCRWERKGREGFKPRGPQAKEVGRVIKKQPVEARPKTRQQGKTLTWCYDPGNGGQLTRGRLGTRLAKRAKLERSGSLWTTGAGAGAPRPLQDGQGGAAKVQRYKLCATGLALSAMAGSPSSSNRGCAIGPSSARFWRGGLAARKPQAALQAGGSRAIKGRNFGEARLPETDHLTQDKDQGR